MPHRSGSTARKKKVSETALTPMLAQYPEPFGPPAVELNARLLATVLRESNDAITMLNMDGLILSWNRKAELLYGYAESDAAGKDFRKAIPDEGGAIQQLLERARRGDFLREMETRRLTRDGRTVDLWLTATLLKDAGDHPSAIAITERDITDRKRSERELEERVNRRTHELEILHEVAARANEARSVEDLIGFCLERVCLHNDWRFGHAYMVARDGTSKLVPSRAWYGSPAERFRAFHEYTAEARLEIPGNLVWRVLESGRAQWTTQVVADFPPSVSAMISQLDFNTALAFPAHVSGDVVAILEFFSNHIDLPGEGITSLMASVGTQLANAMERDSLRRQLLELTDSEEERLAKDLHDAVGQELAGLLMTSESICRRMRQAESPESEDLAEVVDGLRNVLRDIRLLARGLGHIHDGPGDLARMLGHLAAHSKLPCDLEVDAHVALRDAGVATYLFRIAQEGLSLAATHPGARRAALRMIQDAGSVVLEIEDDGRPPTDLAQSLGVRLMRQRSRLIGASLSLETEPRNRITCTLPKQ